MSKTAYSDRQLRIATVGELCRQGWEGDKPYYDAALVCPHCHSVMNKATVDPKSGESRPEAAKRVFLSDGFDQECPECECYWYRHTTCVYDYITSRELDEKPYFPYTYYDLPIYKNTQRDPGPWMAAILTKYLHKSASWSAEEINTVSRSNGLGWRLKFLCPLCLKNDPDGFDFHHWDYETDIGCALCRRCHTKIHDRMRASEQSKFSPTGDWRDEAFAIALKEYKSHRPLDLDNCAELVKTRLNIPVTPARISKAYHAKYNGCEHDVWEDGRCENCGVWLGFNENAGSSEPSYYTPY